MVKNTLKSKVHKTQKNQGGGKASKGTKKHNLKRTKGAKGGGKGSRKGGGKGKGGSAPKAPRKKQTKQDEGPDDFVDPTLGPKKRSGRTDEDKQKRAEKFKKEGRVARPKATERAATKRESERGQESVNLMMRRIPTRRRRSQRASRRRSAGRLHICTLSSSRMAGSGNQML